MLENMESKLWWKEMKDIHYDRGTYLSKISAKYAGRERRLDVCKLQMYE